MCVNRIFAAIAALAFSGVFIVRAQTTNSNIIGFTGPEIFPVDDQISLLHSADLRGDGLNDLVMADNLKSKIVLLYNQTGKTNGADTSDSGYSDINDLPPDARFHMDSIPTDERVASMVVTDLNGDGRPDIAFYGDNKDLEVIYNEGTNGWSDPKRWHIDDGSMDGNALASGDLTGDGRTDLVLLGDNGYLYLWKQNADGTMAEPRKIPYSGSPKAVQIADVDGDGRQDLLLVDWESPTPFRVRLQKEDGELGPEIYFKSPAIRSYCADTLDGGNKNYIVTIAENSGRASVSEIVKEPGDVLSGTFQHGQFQVLPLNKTEAAQRGMLWADVDDNGRPSLLVAEPESGQLSVYAQQPDGSLASPKTFPCLAGVSQIATADWNGGGHPTIFLLSQTENAVAITQFDKHGRLPFPTPIPLDGKPIAMAVGSLKPRAKPTLCVIVDKDGQRSLVTETADGKMKEQKLSEDFKGTPTSMAIEDVNQDGRADLVILIPYEKIKVLLQKRDGTFDEEDVDAPGGGIEQPWLGTADLDGSGKSELLLPQKNFIRAVVLEQEKKTDNSTNQPSWVFQVKDQINGAASDSQIVGAVAVPNGNHRSPSIFLFDAQYQQLSLCERDTNGVWQIVKNIDLPVSDFNSMRSVTMGKDHIPSIAFLGQNSVAWMPLAGDDWNFVPLDGYDTPIKDGYLNDVTTGDLENNGRKQLIFLETAKNYLDLVNFTHHHKLEPLERWQVFEEHTFRNSSDSLPEPREALVTDVTGDGKNDLVVVAHDRILVYPQQ
ncbi:MAG TPA: VCBS repeat-containing protein [Candidatus Sulfotelmatobacter sp.]|nr:VCBS repeat-containing protein [Candidatus Sulfotelmatobacter sp.]